MTGHSSQNKLTLVVLSAFLLIIAIGCAPSQTTSGSSPEAIFTQAVQTASVRETEAMQTLQSNATAYMSQFSPDELTATAQFLQSLSPQITATPEVTLPTQTNVPLATEAVPQPTSIPAPESTSTPIPTQQPAQQVPGSETACIPANPPQTGKVLEILDGDTIKAMIDGKTYIVRYIGIDAPEYIKSKEYFGGDALLKNSELVYAKDITLYKDSVEMDPAGRLLRYVKIGDTFVNFLLVNQGFAKAATDNTDTACDAVFQSAQLVASTAKIGIWGKP